MRELKSGTQLASRYTLVRKLGAGGGAETWLASDKLTHASVALKILRDGTASTSALHREWQLSMRLVHPHIARVFEFHDADDKFHAFYTMQFIDGPDLSALHAAPAADILAPAGLILGALQYAHKRDVVHRDIKASNILLDANGAPYLVDFGVASSGGEVVGGGSLIAASPQQLDGAPPEASDDIFALGGLLYELLSGTPAYSSHATAQDIREHTPPAVLAASGENLPDELSSLLRDMLSKDADHRPDAGLAAQRLLDAGFPAAPAPARYVAAARSVGDELIQSNETVLRTKHSPAGTQAEAPAESSGGMSARTLGISLAALLVLLLGVVFLLPKTVENGADQAPPASEQASESGESTDSDATAPPADPGEAVLPERDERVQVRADADAILGRLLSRLRTLEGRAVQRWGGLPFRQAEEAYAAGDAAYLEDDYRLATAKYQEAHDILEPLLVHVDEVFQRTLRDANTALEAGDTAEALRLFELAVAITPGHGPARAGLVRARNLDEVKSLTEQGLKLERELELAAAQQSFARAIELDPEWQVAKTGLERVLATLNEQEFQQRMTEGLSSLSHGDYLGARAAFRMAQALQPESREPADGLMQVDQGIRLGNISALEQEAASLVANEEWQQASTTYDRLLELDANLAFAIEGKARAQQMIALHKQLDEFIAAPDSLSAPRTMQSATNMVVDITRMSDVGPRLASRRDELSRLLKRAATPLTVQLQSDNATAVSIYKVGKLGSFTSTTLDLRPGTYVAVGSRPGFRDVRLEFRVAPEIDMQPIVVRCEEAI